jgi:hypothetical protein
VGGVKGDRAISYPQQRWSSHSGSSSEVED